MKTTLIALTALILGLSMGYLIAKNEPTEHALKGYMTEAEMYGLEVDEIESQILLLKGVRYVKLNGDGTW